MSADRWVVLGLGHPRAGWFSELSRWSTAAVIPVDFVKCVSPDEVRARLSGGRSYSTLLVGGDSIGFDRDLVETVRAAGASVIVVDPPTERNWAELGVAGVLPAGFDRSSLLAVLREHASPIARITSVPSPTDTPLPDSRRGRLIAVTGPGGTGASVAAMSTAQAFADEAGETGSVLLADLCLDAEMGMLHDSREVIPGVQELVDAHRGGRLTCEQVRSLAFGAGTRGYDLLLGLRRHRDWTAMRPQAFAASLESLLRSYPLVVADVDPDIEDEPATGSFDVEDRNVMARTTLAHADIVVVVGRPTTKGIHSLCRVLRELHAGELDASHLLPVFTRAPRSPRRRAETARTVSALLSADGALAKLGNPVFVGARDIEDSIRDGVRLPNQLSRTLHRELRRRLRDEPTGSVAPLAARAAPEPVTPGSLGTWTEAG